jgi:hypothetical protein
MDVWASNNAGTTERTVSLLETTEIELREAVRLIGSKDFNTLTPHEQYGTYVKAAVNAAINLKAPPEAQCDMFSNVMETYLAGSPWKVQGSWYETYPRVSPVRSITSGSPDNILTGVVVSPIGTLIYRASTALADTFPQSNNPPVDQYCGYFNPAAAAAVQVVTDDESLRVFADVMDSNLANSPWKIGGSMYYLFEYDVVNNIGYTNDPGDDSNLLYNDSGFIGPNNRVYMAATGLQAL